MKDQQSDASARAARADVERLGKGAVELLAGLKQKGEEVREKSKAGYGRALEAHMLLTGAVRSMVARQNGKVGKTSEQLSKRLLLIASFVQGIDLTETSVSEGLYLQAAALLKQELETIAALAEVREGKRVDQRTPNVGVVPWSLGQLYGALNAAAHVAESGVLQTILGMEKQGDAIPVALEPSYKKEIANNLHGLHVALLALLVTELDLLHNEMYGEGLDDTEKRALLVGVESLTADGFLQTPAKEGGSEGKPKGVKRTMAHGTSTEGEE